MTIKIKSANLMAGKLLATQFGTDNKDIASSSPKFFAAETASEDDYNIRR